MNTRQILKWVGIVSLLSLIPLYNLLGVFIIQPIGMLPEGQTIIYVRYGYNMDFIESVDNMLYKANVGNSLLGYALAYGIFGEIIKDKKVLRLPYSETLYNLSISDKSKIGNE